MNSDHIALLHGYLNNTLSESEFSGLQSLLRTDPEARRTLRSLATVDAKLHQLGAANPALIKLLDTPFPNTPNPKRWLAATPAAAAVAGLLLGLFCASMVFAYIAPTAHRPVTLFECGFETSLTAQPLGVPPLFGTWGGDHSEIVGPNGGVNPRNGNKMWRFLSAENSTETDSSLNYVGEAIHVLDLSPLRTTDTRLGSQIEISAWFAQGSTPPEARYHWNIKAAAFEGDVSDAPRLWGNWDDLSASLVRREIVAEPSSQWQHLSVTMTLPQTANFLVFEFAVVQRKPAIKQGAAHFPAHYLDDVRVRVLTPSQQNDTPK
jgi:hypothetical protein